jgi:hypothetical protein
MRRSTLVLTAVGVSAAAITGSAFTASNDVTAVTNQYAGYGEVTVSGATVTDVAYTPYTSDNTDLGSVTFTTTTHLSSSSETASLTLKSGSSVVGSAYACTINSDWDGTKLTITCDTSSVHPAFTTFDTTGLTVVH